MFSNLHASSTIHENTEYVKMEYTKTIIVKSGVDRLS